MAAIIAIHRMRKRRKLAALRQSSIFVDRSDPFTMTDAEFKNIFILSKYAVKDLCNVLRPALRKSSKVYSVELQVLSCLHLLSSNKFQNIVSCSDFMRLSQATMSRNMDRFLAAIIPEIHKHIIFPITPNHIEQVTSDFFHSTGFSGLVGCMDCFHIVIKQPTENSNSYSNFKNEFSIKVQLICDSEMKIINVIADCPGGYNHYTIWKDSTVRNMFEKGLLPKRHFVVADNMYSIEPWLMTPYEEVKTPNQQQYNALHQNSLRIIKRCLYHLKSKFKLLKQNEGTKLLYSPEKVNKIILACCILYNIWLKYNVDDIDSDVLEDEIESVTVSTEPKPVDVVPEELAEQGFLLRDEIASELC